MNMQQLAEALLRYSKEDNRTKEVGRQSAATLLTQPGGLFTVSNMDRTVISTHVNPMGLGSYLPAFTSNIDDPRYGLITGFSAASGAEPVYPCDDAPTGYMKAGTLTAQFGRIVRQTPTLEIDALLHESRNATRNLQLLNNNFGANDSLIGPISTDNMLTNVIKSEMVGVGVQLERKLAVMLWNGTPAANTAQGGYKEFPGLDAQIATGQKDAESGVLLPSVDSTIINFGDNVDSTTRDIVEVVSGTAHYLQRLANQTGLAPTQWAIVMRPELFQELTAIWPCRYLTNGCTTSSGETVAVINDDANVRFRDEMRRGSYLTINGVNYNVILDDGIVETSVAGGTFASTIYFVPLRVRGSFPALYWEHIDYRQVNPMLDALGAGAGKVPFWTDNGRLLWVYRQNGYCFDLQTKIEPRVVLRTPQLAAKIQNVRYTPFIHDRSFLPTSPYWVNGGVSNRPFTPGQSVWQ